MANSGWLSKLQAIVKVDKLFDNFSFFSNNDNRQVNLKISLPENGTINPQILKSISLAIREGFEKDKDGFLALSESTDNKIQEITTYSQSGIDSESRKFIRECLPNNDRSIWFSALILRNKFEQGNRDSVRQIKQDIVNQYHTRGSNIANLCNERYLESQIIPLYQYLVGEKGHKQQFVEIYETIVTEVPYAVFSSQIKSYIETKSEVLKKIHLLKKYGWNKVSIHGIGEDNVSKVEKIINEIKVECQSDIDNIEVIADRIRITATINLKTC